MTKYKSYRVLNGKPKWVVVDEKGKIIDESPKSEELVNLSIEKKPEKPEKCDICKRYYRDIPAYGHPLKEYKNEIWTGKWTCYHCYNMFKTYGTYEKPIITYEKCGRCQKDFKDTPGYPRREIDENGKGMWTGRMICQRCYFKDYQKNNPNSSNNTQKKLTNIRTGNVDPESNQAKGKIFEDIVCIIKEVKNLNVINDNYCSTIDHTPDSEGIIYQTKGSLYNNLEEKWKFCVGREFDKNYDYIILICADEQLKKIMRVYEIPKEEIQKRVGLSILSDNKNHWYNKYRVDEKPYNDVLQKILIKRQK